MVAQRVEASEPAPLAPHASLTASSFASDHIDHDDAVARCLAEPFQLDAEQLPEHSLRMPGGVVGWACIVCAQIVLLPVVRVCRGTKWSPTGFAKPERIVGHKSKHVWAGGVGIKCTC